MAKAAALLLLAGTGAASASVFFEEKFETGAPMRHVLSGSPFGCNYLRKAAAARAIGGKAAGWPPALAQRCVMHRAARVDAASSAA
jgi:hypothetical protein